MFFKEKFDLKELTFRDPNFFSAGHRKHQFIAELEEKQFLEILEWIRYSMDMNPMHFKEDINSEHILEFTV